MPTLRALAICFLAFPLLAQTPLSNAGKPAAGTPNPLSEVVTVDYVEVPVNVVDRAGNPLRDLTKANFEVYDNKKRVDISSFETIDFTSQESLLKSAHSPAAHRAFLLLFDLGYSSPKSLERAEEAARTFVTKNVQRGDLVAVATIDNQRGYQIVSSFTSDRGATLAAVHNPAQFRAADPLQLAAQPSLSKLSVDADIAAADARGAAALQLMADQMNSVQTSIDAEARQHVFRQVDWLSQLAASLRNVRGRKQIVLLTEGFDSRLVQGRTAHDQNQENEEAALIMNGAWWSDGKAMDMDRRYGSTTSLSALQILKQAFTGADVTLNAIDIRGVRMQAENVRGELTATNDGLYLLANPTGGTVFTNSNDLTDNFARMLHQQEFVYVLGFQTTVTSPGKLHDLSVNLVSVPGGVHAMHRLGYFEGGTKYTPTERTINAADVIVRDIPQDAVHLAVLPVPFPAIGEKASVPVVLEINGADLLKNAAGTDVNAELFLYAFDESGVVVDRLFDRLTLDVTKTGGKLRANGVKYITSLSLPPGNYAVKSLVRIAGSDRMGFARNDIRVPKMGEVALLPPFVLDDPASWLLVEGGKGAPYPFAVNGEPFVPSVTGRTAADVVRKVAVFVQNAGPEELTWETTPHTLLLAEVKSGDGTKLVLQVDGVAGNFGVTVHKAEAVLRASTSLSAVAKQ